MKHEQKGLFSEKAKLIYEAVSILILLGGVVVSLVNYYTLNQLAPLSNRIKVVEAEQSSVAADLTIYKSNQSFLINTLVTKDQMSAISSQLKEIQTQVDYLYQHNLR